MDKPNWEQEYEKKANMLQDEYLKRNAEYQRCEKNLKDALLEFDPIVKKMGEEIWQKYDGVLTAHNECEAAAIRIMYIKGALDASEQ